MVDDRRPERACALGDPAEDEPEHDGDRHEGARGALVLNGDVREPEERRLPEVCRSGGGDAVEGAEQETAELQLLRDRLEDGGRSLER